MKKRCFIMSQILINQLSQYGIISERRVTESFEHVVLSHFGIAISYNPNSKIFIVFKDNHERKILLQSSRFESVVAYLKDVRDGVNSIH